MAQGYIRRNPTTHCTVEEDAFQYLIKLELPPQAVSLQNTTQQQHHDHHRNSSNQESSLMIKCTSKGSVLHVEVETVTTGETLLSRVFMLSDDAVEDQIYSALQKEGNTLVVVIPKRRSSSKDDDTETTADDGLSESKEPVSPIRKRTRCLLYSLFGKSDENTPVIYTETLVQP